MLLGGGAATLIGLFWLGCGMTGSDLDGLLTGATVMSNLFGHTLLAIAGMALVGGAGWGTFHAVRQLLFWPYTRATIVRYWIRRDSEGRQRFYFPVMRFCTDDGDGVTTISSWGSWRRPWPVGTGVVVRYNPRDPRWAEISCFANLWGIPLTCIALLAWIGLFWWLGWLA